MNLYIKTEEGYSIKQRSEYSKIKCYLKENQINNEELIGNKIGYWRMSANNFNYKYISPEN